VGADEIKKSCELKMGGNCEVFGVVVPKENADPKIHPFVTHEGVVYVWGGSSRFDRLNQKSDKGKIKWVDDDGNIYFVGVPEAGSTTQLETLYYVDPDGKVLELPKPWGKLLASGIKPTPTTPATATSTKEWTPTPFSPTLTPIPPTVPRPTVVVQLTVIPATPRPTDIPKPTPTEAQNALPADWPAWIRQHPEYGWIKIDNINGGLWSTQDLPVDVCTVIKSPNRLIRDWPYDPSKPQFEKNKSYVKCLGDVNGFIGAFQYNIK
jgi:hypothetical protein